MKELTVAPFFFPAFAHGCCFLLFLAQDEAGYFDYRDYSYGDQIFHYHRDSLMVAMVVPFFADDTFFHHYLHHYHFGEE
jgi:hypothetical protein